MKNFRRSFLLFGVVTTFILNTGKVSAQYNTMWIPDTLSGTQFNLVERDTFRQFLPGQQTIAGSIGNGSVWGPTLIWKKGDSIQVNVTNLMNDTTTLHWHGIHLPAIMDGGPYQVIPPNSTWHPSFRVKNNAATYWYHPHLHMMTHQQMNMGLGGLIIIRDSAEGALNLPRKYGTDDIPLVLGDRRFDSSNQFVLCSYGDTMMANFTLNAQYNVPAQVIRFRILNTAPERFYNLGFSDNRTFYVIGSDGGLLAAPVGVTKKLLAPGERVEILVNFNGQSGTSVNLRAFNAALANDYPGWQPVNYSNLQFRNDLGGRDFNILHLNVVAQKANAVTSIPVSLISSVFPDPSNAVITRTIAMTSGGTACPSYAPGCYVLNGSAFDLSRIDYRPVINTTEIWELTNTSNIAHPFHIHDAQFNVYSVNGAAPQAADRGWKDVVVVRKNATVKFVVSFSDYADSLHPFMYHCHMAPHEDGGMMGQFTVMPLCIPSITSLLPEPLGAGALATIKGQHLGNLSQVKFNGSNASYTLYNDTIFTSTVPAGVTSGNLQILNNCGSATVPYTTINTALITAKFYLQGLFIQTDSMRSVIPGYADSVKVLLFTPENLNSPALTVAAMLKTNGKADCTVPVSFLGRSYYLCVKHRNSLETWSRLPVTIANAMVFDFTH